MAQKLKDPYETNYLFKQNETQEELQKQNHRIRAIPQKFDQLGYIPYHTEFLELS